MRPEAERASAGTCPSCGKQRYVSRHAARQAAKRKHPGCRMSAYRCDGYWHIGRINERYMAWLTATGGTG